jgi:hypothetical protein
MNYNSLTDEELVNMYHELKTQNKNYDNKDFYAVIDEIKKRVPIEIVKSTDVYKKHLKDLLDYANSQNPLAIYENDIRIPSYKIEKRTK